MGAATLATLRAVTWPLSIRSLGTTGAVDCGAATTARWSARDRIHTTPAIAATNRTTIAPAAIFIRRDTPTFYWCAARGLRKYQPGGGLRISGVAFDLANLQGVASAVRCE